MKEHSTFGVLLRRYRQAAGVSQETLAAQAGLSTRAISDLERGINRNPRSDTLDLLAGALPLTSHQQNLLRSSARPGRAAGASPVSPSHGLPLSPTAMIGREQEHTRALALIQRSQVRLLTITGPSGVGKTRFALQVAKDLCEELTDGVSFVALAPVRDAALVPEVLGQTLHLHEQIDHPMTAPIRAFLQHKQLLLVLDNFEHLL